jgi:antitoxin VapB
MNLQIRDPRANQLADQIARARQCTKTEAVIQALDAELARLKTERPLLEVVKDIQARIRRKSKGKGHDMTKDEIDAMWGHE